jgi:hypothetical protein
MYSLYSPYSSGSPDPTIIYPNTLDFLGSSWAIIPAGSFKYGINIVKGLDKIIADILSVALERRGHRPLHPKYGLAPLLFEPLSDIAPQYWIHELRDQIELWVEGIESVTVSLLSNHDMDNSMEVQIVFIPKIVSDQNVLSFDYYSYQGAAWDKGIEEFISGVALNGEYLVPIAP